MGEDEEEEEDGGGLRVPTKGEAAAEWCGDGVGGRELRLALAWLCLRLGMRMMRGVFVSGRDCRYKAQGSRCHAYPPTDRSMGMLSFW